MAAKGLDSQNVWGAGGGNRRYPYKLKYLAENDQNSTYINLLSYFAIWSAIINSLIFILIKKNSFKFIFFLWNNV